MVRIVRHIHVGGRHVGLYYSYNRVNVAAEDVGVCRKEKERSREGRKGITRLRDASTTHVTLFSWQYVPFSERHILNAEPQSPSITSILMFAIHKI